MSLINQMLRDLESRRVTPAAAGGGVATLALEAERLAAAGTPAGSAQSPGHGRGSQRWLIGTIVLLALLLGLLLWSAQPPWQDGAQAVATPAVKPLVSVPVVQMTVEPADSAPSVPEPAVVAQTAVAKSATKTVAKPIPQPASATQPVSEPSLPAKALPAKVQGLRVRSVNGVTRIFVELGQAAVYHTALADALFTLTLSGVSDTLLALPDLGKTAVDDVVTRYDGGELSLAFHFDETPQLRSAVMTEGENGARLVVTLAAQTSPAAQAPSADSSAAVTAAVTKHVRPLNDEQRAEQALRRGVGLLGQGRQAEAELALQEALKLDPRLQRARETLAALYLNSGRSSETRGLLAEGLRLSPQAAGLAQLYARLMADQGDLAAALVALLRARPPLAENPDYHALLAALLQRAGQHEQAVQTYRQLLAQRGTAAPWWMGLAISLEAEGETTAALEAYVKAHQLGAGLGPQVLEYLGGRIRALAPRLAAAKAAVEPTKGGN